MMHIVNDEHDYLLFLPGGVAREICRGEEGFVKKEFSKTLAN
jgi:hypothetical protein